MESAQSEPTTDRTEMGRRSSTAPESAERAPRRVSLRAWILAVAAGIAAGFVAWLASEPAHTAFRPQAFSHQVLGRTYQTPTIESQRESDLKNATLVFMILGGLTGLAMGLAGGATAHTVRRGVVIGLAALVAGSTAAALACRAFVPLFFRELVPDVNDLVTPMLLHGGIWAVIGAVGGAAYAIGLKCRWLVLNAIGAACLGGFLASILFHVIGGVLSAGPDITTPVAESTGLRLLMMMLVTVLVALGAARAALHFTSRPSLAQA
jgi:hypothetical protein